MKAERRSKYSGTKLHADEKECQAYLDWHALYKKHKGGVNNPDVTTQAVTFAKTIAKAIKLLMKEHPDLLKERTETQIAEALERDKQKILKQQKAMATKGGDWKAVT